MADGKFDYTIADSQGTSVEPIAPGSFDADRYADYAAALDERCEKFWKAAAGVAVYRRVRVPEVFSFGCADMKESLARQLAGLELSMRYEADVPNFLEPWYGIGTIAACFGAEYEWPEGQAPAVTPMFSSVEQALNADVAGAEQTAIGKRTLEMIEYFLETTGGKVPMSLTDTQSPMNTASNLVSINDLMMEIFDNPDGVSELLNRIADLLADFTHKQAELIGDALVWPGHGFAGSRKFDGLGMSDDIMVMLLDQQYRRFEVPSILRAAEDFGAPVFHSCGNWSAKAGVVARIEGLKMADGAFSEQTDPDPNPPGPFVEAFSGTGICLNARMVGDAEVVAEKAAALYDPGMKLLVVTYCQTPDDQAAAYRAVHALAE